MPTSAWCRPQLLSPITDTEVYGSRAYDTLLARTCGSIRWVNRCLAQSEDNPMRTANPMHTTKGTPRQPICRGHCRDGRPCPNHACYGWSVCRMHGAGTPRGQASPHYVDGRYSKELPSRLRERYDQAASDPDLLVLRSDISLLDVRLGELVASLDSVGAPARLATIQRAAGAYRDAMGTDKEDPALAHLLSTIDAGTVDDDATWETIMASLEQRRKLVESERKR